MGVDNAAGTTGSANRLMGRRAFLIGGAGVGLALPVLGPAAARAAPSGVPSEGKVAFRVLRKGAHIGEHALRFDQDSDGLTVTTDVHIVVKVGPVPVYRYTQHFVERWRGERFVSLDSTTNSNTSRDKVTVKRGPDGLHVELSTGAPFTLSGDSTPMTHWNRFGYQAPLFNPHDGKALKVSLVSRAEDTVKLADGSSVRATRYSITGDSVMDDYYDGSGVWTGLHSRVQDGSYVDYLRL